MTQEERDKVQEDILYYLIENNTLLSRIGAVLEYPIRVYETGRGTRY